MAVVTSLSFLIFVGVLNFEGADSFPDIDDNCIAALFVGGVVIEGEVRGAHEVPDWMRPGAHRPYSYEAYIRTFDDNQYESTFETYREISLNHESDNPQHGPTYAEIKINHLHYTARNFYRHQQLQADQEANVLNTSRNNQIYVTLPNGAIYQSRLEPHMAQHRLALA